MLIYMYIYSVPCTVCHVCHGCTFSHIFPLWLGPPSPSPPWPASGDRGTLEDPFGLSPGKWRNWHGDPFYRQPNAITSSHAYRHQCRYCHYCLHHQHYSYYDYFISSHGDRCLERDPKKLNEIQFIPRHGAKVCPARKKNNGEHHEQKLQRPCIQHENISRRFWI